jgi:UDP-N-acetylmuramate--alanine ligase
MTTEALAAAGLAPTGIAGGRVNEWGGNAKPGGDRLFVVEADEYDQAFLALTPSVAVVNNVEADHLECYGSLEALEQAFVTFAGRAGRILIGADDPGAGRVTGSRATLSVPGRSPVTLRLQVPGIHNLRNASAALGVVVALGGEVEPALEALARYRGLGRRFERLGEVRGIALVDDYAHHPSELEATLAAARQAFPGRRLFAVFQPHLYSRTAQHGIAMGRALAAADLVIVTSIYPAREQPIPGVTAATVADAARDAGARVVYEPDRERVGDRIHEMVREGDVVITLGAGDITRVGRELAQWLNAA